MLKAGIALLLHVRQVTSALNSKLDDKQQRALQTHGTVATVTKTREQTGLHIGSCQVSNLQQTCRPSLF